jgi:hypothetical protein
MLVIVPIVVALEAIGWISATLRPYRWHLRALVVAFCALVPLVDAGTRQGILPDNLHFGAGVLRFASDSFTYRTQAAAVATALREGSPAALLEWEYFTYARLLGIVFALFGTEPLVGMLFNAVFYVSTLVCVLLLGRALFGARTGVVAMSCMALWPGFVMHETQTIRWVMTTAALLAVMTAIVGLMRTSTAWAAVAGGGVGYAILLFDMPYMARLVQVALLGFAGLLLLPRLRRGAGWPPVIRVAAAGIVAFVAYQIVWSPGVAAVELADLERIVEAREEFVAKTGHAATSFSNLRELDGVRDLVLNLPAAFQAALFAPYPGMLLAGSPGVSNLRHWVLAEMSVYYVMLPFAAVGVVAALRHREVTTRLPALFLLLFTLGCYGLLGTIVINAGTLYRMRLPFVLIQSVFAVAGFFAVLAFVRSRRYTGAVAAREGVA